MKWFLFTAKLASQYLLWKLFLFTAELALANVTTGDFAVRFFLLPLSTVPGDQIQACHTGRKHANHCTVGAFRILNTKLGGGGGEERCLLGLCALFSGM